MQTKVYEIENLCCANCAAKIEDKMNAHPGVERAVITFATRQLRLTAEDPDALLSLLQELARSIEPDVAFHFRDAEGHSCSCGHGHCGCQQHSQDTCSCGSHHQHDCEHGHNHEHEHSHKHGHSHNHNHDHKHEHNHDQGHHHDHDHSGDDPRWLIAGAVLFALGLLTEGWWSVAVCAAAFLILGWEVLHKAVINLFRGHVMDENFLMAVASLGAFLIGNAPEGVGVMLFYRIGEYFEHRAVERSRSNIMEAVDLRPETVNLISGETIPARDAKVGDILLVRPGDRIPLDGVVLSGVSRLDTAPITGESVPLAVGPGSQVLSGCVNTSGQLTLRAEKPLSQSMVTRILNSVENAAAGKPKIDRFITRFARIYTPVVVAIAAATAVLPSLATGNWEYWIYTALSFLVMSCPCALVLSVPLAFFAGIGSGSKKGILFKDGVTIEALSGIRAVVMDKTGTLTKGDFRVQKVEGPAELLALCAACEEHSSHPVAVSITAAAREQGLSWEPARQLQELPGRGIQASVQDHFVLLGNAQLLRDHGITPPAIEAGAATVVYCAVDGAYAGCIHISDTVKEDAAAALQTLRSRGYTTAMLTGDTKASAQDVAGQLGIDACYASLLPHEKLETLRAIRKEKGAVLFVGDGINDAPVLAGADVGAAMGSGADAAIEAADVVFMTSQAEAIPAALDIAKKTSRIAWQNVIFALGIKFLVMALGLLGFASMWLAVFADSGVAMLCVLNSIRLLYRNK